MLLAKLSQELHSMDKQIVRDCRRWIFGWSLLAVVLAGCAEGPFNGGGTWNPYLKKEWEKDEQRGPTFHTKMQQLKQLKAQAATLPVDRQEALATEMALRYREEGNTLLRGAVVGVMGQLRSANVDDALTAAMQDSDAEVRILAARALGARGNEMSLQTLAKAMGNESNLDVRMAITRELSNFKNSPEATRALALALDDNDAALQYRAIQSLELVTGRNYGVNARAWREYLAGGNPPAQTPSVADRVKGWKLW
jgi:hypothetical protein